MDADDKELSHHLFAVATRIAEAAHDAAVSGQAPDIPAANLIRAAEDLDRHGGDLQTIARAIRVATEPIAAQ